MLKEAGFKVVQYDGGNVTSDDRRVLVLDRTGSGEVLKTPGVATVVNSSGMNVEKALEKVEEACFGDSCGCELISMTYNWLRGAQFYVVFRGI